MLDRPSVFVGVNILTSERSERSNIQTIQQMVLTIIVAFISLISLFILHEFGHFILAKLFGVSVEEFGIGYPPRLFGKKIGQTLYSLNLLPFGAFVKIPGEIEKIEQPRSFSSQPVGKRALIVFGGVLSFWIISAILFSIVFSLGAEMTIGDEETKNVINPKVQIADVAADSPAQIVGLKVGDIIKEFRIQNLEFRIEKVKEIQEFTEKYKGEEITLTIERGKEVFDVKLTPRVSPPAGEGPIGIALVRTGTKVYPWWLSPWQGALTTVKMTGVVIEGYYLAIKNSFLGQPSGIELMGPVGIFHLFVQASELGVSYFLQFIGMIAIYVALFNILPIPSVDGGKLLFLGIEAIRKKPINPKTEQNITATFFIFLVALSILVAIKDLSRIF